VANRIFPAGVVAVRSFVTLRRQSACIGNARGHRKDTPAFTASGTSGNDG